MNKEYIQSGETFIVSTDSGLKKVERLNNMTEILETENNIEEIENLKKQNDLEELFSYKNILDYVEKKFFKNFFGIAIPIIIIITILTAIISNIDIALITLPMSLCGTGLVTLLAAPLNMHKSHKINKNIYESADVLLNSELENQKEKMKELKKESKVLANNDLGILNETIKIEKSKLIEGLKRKLELIEDYQLMKDDLIEYSKDHFTSPKLRDMGYSEGDVEFIQMLMKQDIQEKEKAKTLKLEKK